MKKISKLNIAAAFLTTFLIAGIALAASQTHCPIMGGQINKQLYADHDGKRVYFCCPACLPTFEKDPEKYIKIIREKGQEPETISK